MKRFIIEVKIETEDVNESALGISSKLQTQLAMSFGKTVNSIIIKEEEDV